jgi:CBS domain containing-hemolysin-like protein
MLITRSLSLCQLSIGVRNNQLVETSTATVLAGVALLIVIKVMFTLGFSATIHARKSVLKERAESGHRAAARALQLGENATTLQAIQQFVSILTNAMIIALITIQFFPDIEQLLVDAEIGRLTSQILALFILLPIVSMTLMIIDRLATSLVMGRAEMLAVILSQPNKWVVGLLSPIVMSILRVSGRTAVLMGGSELIHLVTEEEIKTLVDAGSEEGVLEDEEKEMIYSIIRFGDTLAREVMVPRIDIIALEVGATLEEALDIIINAGHSRIPIYKDTIDNIEGLLYAKDLLKVWRNGDRPESLESLLRMPNFVPETKKASELLVELQEQKTHLVFVVDEYGGTAGIITMEDLVEEIVGEIQDEYDFNEEAQYEQISENEYMFNARIDLDDLNHLLDTSIPTDESDTLGGYIFSQLGRVPLVNDEIVADNLAIRIMSVTGRRIRKVQVRKIVEEASPTHVESSSNGVLRLGNKASTSIPDTQSVNS